MTMRRPYRQPNGYPRHIGSNGIRFELTDRDLRVLRGALELYRDASRTAPPEANAGIASKLLHLLCAGELPDESPDVTAWRLSQLSGEEAVRFRAAMVARPSRPAASYVEPVDANDFEKYMRPERATGDGR